MVCGLFERIITHLALSNKFLEKVFSKKTHSIYTVFIEMCSHEKSIRDDAQLTTLIVTHQ